MAKGRQTPQKKIILHLIQDSRLPLTAEQVFEQARGQFPNLALTTVYRNLEAFAAEGLVRASVYDDGVKRYELAERHRHYMTCVECKKSVEIPECPFEELKDKLAQETGFDISGHSMEFFEDGIEHILRTISKDHPFKFRINEEKDSIVIYE